MAKVDDSAQDSEDNSKKKKGLDKKLILFIVLILVLVAVSIGGTLLAVKLLTPEPSVSNMDENVNAGDPDELVSEEAEIEIKPPAIYFPMKPALIVNFPARGRQRYLQAEITLMSREDDVIEAIEIHMPMIRNALILTFSGHDYQELQTDEGRELLRQAVLMEVQTIMEREIGKPGVEKVLFTNFVMQ